MDFYALIDTGILREFGSRICNDRLNSNLSQKIVAERAGVSLRVVQNIEHGKVTTTKNFLRVLRALKLIDNLCFFIPESNMRPSEITKLQGRIKKRAPKNSLKS